MGRLAGAVAALLCYAKDSQAAVVSYIASALDLWLGAAHLGESLPNHTHSDSPTPAARCGRFACYKEVHIMATWIKWFAELTIDDVPSVGEECQPGRNDS